MLSSDPCLAFYHVSKLIIIQVDASNSGLGEALLQERKPVAYAPRSLTNSEKNYAITEKELLAVLFGCERYHQYIYGNKAFIESGEYNEGTISNITEDAAMPTKVRFPVIIQIW